MNAPNQTRAFCWIIPPTLMMHLHAFFSTSISAFPKILRNTHNLLYPHSRARRRAENTRQPCSAETETGARCKRSDVVPLKYNKKKQSCSIRSFSVVWLFKQGFLVCDGCKCSPTDCCCSHEWLWIILLTFLSGEDRDLHVSFIHVHSEVKMNARG